MSFSTEVELALTVPSSELRSARAQIEGAIGDMSVGVSSEGPAARATGGGGGGAGGRRGRRLFRWARQRTSLMEDTVGLLESIDDKVGEGGGGGGLLGNVGLLGLGRLSGGLSFGAVSGAAVVGAISWPVIGASAILGAITFDRIAAGDLIGSVISGSITGAAVLGVLFGSVSIAGGAVIGAIFGATSIAVGDILSAVFPNVSVSEGDILGAVFGGLTITAAAVLTTVFGVAMTPALILGAIFGGVTVTAAAILDHVFGSPAEGPRTPTEADEQRGTRHGLTPTSALEGVGTTTASAGQAGGITSRDAARAARTAELVQSTNIDNEMNVTVDGRNVVDEFRREFEREIQALRDEIERATGGIGPNP